MNGEFNVKLTIVTHYLPNHAELGQLTSASKREYANRWGYGFHEQIGDFNALGFDFQRIAIIKDLFEHSDAPDVIWWLGCDTMVMNHTKPVTDIMGVLPWQKSFWIARDVNGLNNDSFLIRRSEWSMRWLSFILSLEEQYRGDVWQSQRIMQHYGETPQWSDGIQIVPPNCFNSYRYQEYDWTPMTAGNFRTGDLILHLPGMNLSQRLAIFRSPSVQDSIIRLPGPPRAPRPDPRTAPTLSERPHRPQDFALWRHAGRVRTSAGSTEE